MTFLSVLTALILEHYLTWHRRDRLIGPFLRWADFLRRRLDAGSTAYGAWAWGLAIAPLFVFGVLLHNLAVLAGGPALAWLLDTLVLGAVIDFKTLSDRLAEIGLSLRGERLQVATQEIEAWEGSPLPGEFDLPGLASRAIQLALLHAHWRVLAPILWFVLLPGSSGPLVYAGVIALQRRWVARATDAAEFGWCAQRMLRFFDWLPARMTALAFAVVGNFEEAFYCLRNQSGTDGSDGARIILAAGAGALGVHFEAAPLLPFGVSNGDLGTGDFPGPEHLQNAEGLLARTLVFAVVLLGLLTLGNLISI